MFSFSGWIALWISNFFVRDKLACSVSTKLAYYGRRKFYNNWLRFLSYSDESKIIAEIGFTRPFFKSDFAFFLSFYIALRHLTLKSAV